MLRLLTAGESHGQALSAILDGMPAGLHLSQDDLNSDLKRRQTGYGRGGRMRIESDKAQALSGLRFGKTLGTPIALLIENRDWENWQDKMSPFGPPPSDIEVFQVPRPGHADLAGYYKYGFTDLRDVLERASARETAARVAAGAIVRKLLREFGVEVFSHVISIGNIGADFENITWEEIRNNAEASPLRCADSKAEEVMMKHIDSAREKGDSVGGIFQLVALGVAPGLGSYAQWDRRLDGRLAGALMSIPAVKGVGFGLGFEAAKRFGSEVHDEILQDDKGNLIRLSNNAGGLEGGLSNGEPIIMYAAMKPIPTLTKPLRSVNLGSGEAAPAGKERSDVCAVPAAGVVGEAMCCMIMADAYLEKFGSDTIDEMKLSWRAYCERIGL